MNLFYSVKHPRKTSKVDVRRAIVLYLIIQFPVTVLPAFADEEVEKNNPVLHNSIAILPFENLSSNSDNAYFAVGIHGEILDQLAKIRDINPISRPSLLRYKDRHMPIAEIASELNVETIMKGSVHHTNNRINIAVQLIDASNNKQLWSEIYERDLSDIFLIQEEIVGHIVMALDADISSAEQERVRKVPTRSLEAYASYMKARILVESLVPGAPVEFYQHLDQAIELDPDFALAHAVKACIYELAVGAGYQLNNQTVEEMKEVARKHTKKALELDPNLGMAHWAQALLQFNSRDGAESIKTYERTLELRPNDVNIIDEYARFLTYIGENQEEAIQLSYRALTLAPNEALWHARFGKTIMYAGNPADAVEVIRRAIKLEPSKYGAHGYHGMIQIILGNETEGLKELRLADEQLVNRNPPFSLCRLAYFYSRLGYHEDAVRLVKRIEKLATNGRHIRISIWAISYLAIGEADKAYNILKQNPNEGISSLQIIQSNILNDPVLKEPRFVALREQIAF